MSKSEQSLKSAVDQLRARHVRAVNAGDTDAAAGIFASNGVFLPPGSPALQGTSAIRAWFTAAFGPFRFEGFGLEPGELEQAGDVVIEHGSWKATMQPRDGSAGRPVGGTYLTVYARNEDGGVSVLRDTFNGLPV